MAKRPLHLLMKPEDVADRAIIAGDPERVKQLSEYLEKPRLVNENRGFLTYTGKYKGVNVTVATHGIGAPSAAIVIEELIELGAKVVIRLGSCGGMREDMEVGDLIIPIGASYEPGGTIWSYAPNSCTAAVPDYEIVSELVKNARKYGIKSYIGPIISSDSFYSEDKNFLKVWKERGMIGVEMECALLFILGRIRGIKTGALLVISDTIKKREEMATAKDLRPVIEKISKIALDTVVSESII